ncbi:hypothetical protein GCM10023206_33510 [Acinetobacter puyangensis]|uniref:Long-chain fatty acid transport protein n=1 Tax=Acinetobacter puyangensis TaxID=1096779 RepID=A0A240EET1_9GAMM|nr:outer membrane protein transport protein [Acinetobacter puyangensis]SNX46475.1 long-chain fatty acid transport protein [Acinetobacter puyangensis]
MKTVSCILFSVLFINISNTYAAALDRSGQSIATFLQAGNYAEIGISIVNPHVSGQLKSDFNKGGLTQAANMDTGNVAHGTLLPSATLKFQLNEHLSLGLLYDHPFGADASYPIKQYPAYTQDQERTATQVSIQSLSSILGYQPDMHWNFYAGPVLQLAEGQNKTRGAGYNWLRYDMKISDTVEAGWLAGFAYTIPEKAIKTSLTYRSEIRHKTDVTESVSALHPINGVIDFGIDTQQIILRSPQSINLELQTGILPKTIAYANLRWVDWSKFDVSPPKLYQSTQALLGKGIALVAYKDDQFSANFGVGRKINDQWSSSITLGWDSGAGDPITTLGPTKGYWSLGLASKFNPSSKYSIGFGIKYFWLGDAKSQPASDFATQRYDGIFKNNYAWGYGLNFGYRF